MKICWLTVLAATLTACGGGLEPPEGGDVAGLERAVGAATCSCALLARTLRRAPAPALPAFARQLVRLDCDRSRACEILLQTRLPQGDGPALSAAIRILGCLSPADDAVINPPPPSPIIVGDDPAFTYVSAGTTGVLGSYDHTNWFSIMGGTLPLPSDGVWSVALILSADSLHDERILAGSTNRGLFRTDDGGSVWRKVSGAGSGLEATSQNMAALLTTLTINGTVDVLVGVAGTSTGGVYLSGDQGEHWTQINQGFDPSTLNITTLAKTSCSGCPVMYYTGTYGSGVYTRTIAVTAPPAISGWCFDSTACTCGTAAPTPGALAGGQPFRICGSDFHALPVVEFGAFGGRVPASGCQANSANVITCTATPAAAGALAAPDGSFPIRVRNTDTRVGQLPVMYTYIAP